MAEKSTILDAVDSGMADVFTQWCAHNQQGEQKGAVVAEGLDKVVVASRRDSLQSRKIHVGFFITRKVGRVLLAQVEGQHPSEPVGQEDHVAAGWWIRCGVSECN